MRVLTLLILALGAVGSAFAAPPKSLQKTRPGSLLKRDATFADPVDLRGDAEKKRDQELAVHYRRLAELDVFAKVAERQGDVKLLERIEGLRRKETQRHQRVLMRLRGASRAALARGGVVGGGTP